MKIYSNSIAVSLLMLFSTSIASGQYEIKGTFIDSEKKYVKIILEYIPSIRGLSSSNINNIVNSSTIDSTGAFYIQGNDLPKEKNLYRLSLLEDGSVSKILNGAKKNYIHIVLDNNSRIELTDCTDISENFGNCHIIGSKQSRIIQNFYDGIRASFYEDYFALNNNYTEVKKQFMFRKHADILKNYCDTSHYLIPSLIAFAHLDNLEEEVELEKEFFTSYLKKISKIDTESPYVEELKNEFGAREEVLSDSGEETSFYWKWTLLGLLVLVGGYALYLRRELKKLRKSLNSADKIHNRLQTLSKKEAEVFEHIIMGKSNKEIASTLYIEVATVKSHVSKIYQKLGVKSRKEAAEFGAKHQMN